MNYKHQCMYMCDLFYTKCPHAANEISSIFDHAEGPGQNCSSYVKKKNAWFVDPFNLTDAGNAKRLSSTHGDNIVYSNEMVNWYIFNGCIWVMDTEQQIYQLAKATAIDLYVAAMNIPDYEKKKKICGYALGLESQKGLKNMIESAQNEPGIPISINDFDKNKDVVCVKNGTLNLRTGELTGFSREEYITKQISTTYNPDAKCPIFENFLDTTFNHDTELIGFMKRFFGYSMTGHTSEQVFCIFYGHGSNGKGTLTDTIMDVMCEYAKTTEPDTIIKKKYERSSTNDLADLKGARLVLTSENEMNQELDEGRIKRITGQDRIKCRYLYREFFEYIPEYSLVLLTNHEPVIKAQDYSIWRRVLKVPFNVTIPKEDWDLNLRNKLNSESEGILTWLVEGAKEWYEGGLNVPESITKATEEYKEESDIIGEFIGLFCDLGEDKQIVNKDIYLIYTGWCGMSGHRPFAPTTFGKALGERNFVNSTIGKFRGKKGLDLKVEVKEQLEELKDIDDERWLMSTLSTFIRGFLESPYRGEKWEVSKKPSVNVDTNRPMPEINSTNEGHHENKGDECQGITNKPHKTAEISSSDTIKIKLIAPKSEYNINGIQYSLKCGDIADVPRKKAEQLINLNMAMNVSGGITS